MKHLVFYQHHLREKKTLHVDLENIACIRIFDLISAFKYCQSKNWWKFKLINIHSFKQWNIYLFVTDMLPTIWTNWCPFQPILSSNILAFFSISDTLGLNCLMTVWKEWSVAYSYCHIVQRTEEILWLRMRKNTCQLFREVWVSCQNIYKSVRFGRFAIRGRPEMTSLWPY